MAYKKVRMGNWKSPLPYGEHKLKQKLDLPVGIARGERCDSM